MSTAAAPDVYGSLRQHLTAGGKYRIPWRKEVMAILRIRFTPEEASLAVAMPVLGQSRVSLTELGRRAGRIPEEVSRLLASMLAKGTVLAQKDRKGVEVYCLWDFLYSLYSPLYGDGQDDDSKRQIAELRERLWQDGYHFIWFSSRFPFNRVMPHEAAIDPSQAAEPWEKASEYVRQAKEIAAVACGCRASTKRCSKPLWTCIYFDAEADYWVRHKGGRKLTPDECLDNLRRGAEAGLVITRANDRGMPRVICQCCNDCCIILRHYTENHSPYALDKSNFVPFFDSGKCRACLTCAKACPVGAIGRVPAQEENKKDRMIVMEQRCIGCGLCAIKCPNQAVKLRRARDIMPPPTIKEAFARYAAETLW